MVGWFVPRRVPERPRGSALFASLTKDLARIRFVQVGSNDAQFGDPLRQHIFGGRWQGLMVEAVPDVHARLARNYAGIAGIRTVCAAISERAGTRMFYSLRPSTDAERQALPEWYDHIASFDRDVILKHAAAIPQLESRIVGIEVECITLDELCDKHGFDRLDVLHVDTEGYDARIVQAADLARWAPRLVVFEHKHLPRDEYASVLAKLDREGYDCVSSEDDAFCLRRGPWRLRAPLTRATWNAIRRWMPEARA